MKVSINGSLGGDGGRFFLDFLDESWKMVVEQMTRKLRREETQIMISFSFRL